MCIYPTCLISFGSKKTLLFHDKSVRLSWRPRRLYLSPTSIFLTIMITKHAKVNKQKGTEFLQSTAEYPCCVTHLQEMKKIRINTTYTLWAPDAITSLWRQNDVLTFWHVLGYEHFQAGSVRNQSSQVEVPLGNCLICIRLERYVKKDETYTHST